MTLDSLHLPGNATHGFMDFMLMMGVAGEGAKADYVDTYDLFHTMEAYFTWYPNGGATVSKYLLNKFLFTVDRDPELVERYREDPQRDGRVVGGRARPTGSSTATPASRRTWLRVRRRRARPHWPLTTTRSCSSWARTRSSR